MRELFYEFIKEASLGEVEICDDKWPVAFNTIIEGKENFTEERNLSTLYIEEEETFFDVLEEYVDFELQKNRKIPSFYKENDKYKKKWILMYLFSYATTEDFKNPIEYIHKKMDFLKDNTFEELKSPMTIPLGGKWLNSQLEIQEEPTPVSMEVPNRMNLTLKSPEGEIYQLPSIYYGVRKENGKDVCYIYSILSPKEKEEETRYSKKINRLLFKVNDGIEEGKAEEEDIKDVTMSFVLSLNIFISLLQKKKIEKIKVVNYLPVSYLARDISAEKSNRVEELQKRNQMIQENLTEKLIRTFRRLCVQNEALKITSYPYEVDEFLTLSLDARKKELDNMLLEETNRQVSEEKKM